MATTGSRFITKQMQWNANYTAQKHLGDALIAKPEMLLDTMGTLFSARNIYSDNPLMSMAHGNPTMTKTIGTTEWEWNLKGANTRPLIVLENLEAGNQAGKYRRPFKLKLDENWFLPGDILFPGTSDKRYQARVMDGPVRHGDGWIYNMQIVTDDDNLFIPAKYLNYGSQWAKLASAYEEAAEQAGSTQFSMPISLRNHMGKWRKTYSITDYASTEILAIAVVDSNGKAHQTWIRYAEVEFWQQWAREKEIVLWYGRDAKSLVGSTGNNVRLFPGIQEQLEDSNIAYYNHLTAKFIEEYLMDIYYGRTKPGQGRKIVAYTGEYGMLNFHRAVQDWTQKSGFIRNIEQFQRKVSSPYHSNAFSAGMQYVQYDMANGSSLTVVHQPLYDARDLNFEIDPITGYPLESQRMTFLDFSGEGTSSNIQIVKKKDGDAFSYIDGLWGHLGPAQGSNTATSKDAYEMVSVTNLGLQITDVTKCGELILARN